MLFGSKQHRMIVYNVTCNLNPSISEEWLHWMVTEHIPEVMGTGCFLEYKILKLLTESSDNEGVNYAIQYTAASMSDYETYKTFHAPILQAKTQKKYGNSILAYRSLLEIIL